MGITKWVQDGSPSKSTPIKVESPNQFVPLGTSKKEFRRIQTAMKEGRRAGVITAGPESKVLDGATWDEAQAMQEGKTVDHVDYRSAQPQKASSREISNTTLLFSNPLMLEILSTMSQKTSWQNTDALLMPRTILHNPATLRRKNPWAGVLILHLKKVMTRRVRQRRRSVLETIIHFR